MGRRGDIGRGDITRGDIIRGDITTGTGSGFVPPLYAYMWTKVFIAYDPGDDVMFIKRKTGASQENAGALAGEEWIDTTDLTIKVGV